MSEPTTDVIQGTLDMLILKTLSLAPMHGYGIARRIERHYRRYRQRGEASSGMEAWLDKVMVEHTCPDCNGARVRATRLLFTIAGKTIYDVGRMNFERDSELLEDRSPLRRTRCKN